MNNYKRSPIWVMHIAISLYSSRSKTSLSLLLAVSVILMVSEGCAVKQSSAINARSGAATQTKPAEIKISSTEFNYKPARITVKEGQEVIFTLDNRQGLVEHDLINKEQGIQLLAKPGHETSQKLVFTHPASINFIVPCQGTRIPACQHIDR